MTKKKLASPSRVQVLFEHILCIGALVLATTHMLLSIARYNFDFYTYARPFESWFALFLVILAVIYFIYNIIFMQNTMYRLSGLLKRLFHPDSIFVWGLILWYPLSCLINQQAMGINLFKRSDWWMLDTVINGVILFSLSDFLGEEKAKRIIEYMIHAIMIFSTSFAIYCLYNLFTLNVITMPSGYGIGMTRNMQFTIGLHYNITGAIAATMVCLSIYMICTQKVLLRTIYTLALLVHLSVLLLTNSRAAFVAGLAAIVATCFIACYYHLNKKSKKLQIIGSLIISMSVAGVIWILRSSAFVIFDKVTNFRALISNGAAESSSAANSVRALTDLSGRVSIWRASFKVMFYSPRMFFFGVTPACVTAALQQIGGIQFEVAHAHNIILQVGVAFGVPVMTAFIAFLFSIAIKCYRIIFCEYHRPFHGAYAIPVTILMLVVLNMAEAYLVAYFSIMSSVFFLFCGWVSTAGKK